MALLDARCSAGISSVPRRLPFADAAKPPDKSFGIPRPKAEMGRATSKRFNLNVKSTATTTATSTTEQR